MIGKVMIGKSFGGCIAYCLEDKRLKETQEVIFKDRAELLAFNLCYGNKKELIDQFNEVRQLNPKLSKPVMHITLSLAPDEKLGNGFLNEIAECCAKDFGFDKNQYLAVLHVDTKNQHIHIVANRVGFDKKTVSDSNNYRKMAAFCRKMENKFHLKPVLSPRAFLPEEQRDLPRHDSRKELLKQDIRQSLKASNSIQGFERQMNQKGYSLIKGRGIAFMDQQKVRTKGSDVGYSLMKIEKILMQPQIQANAIASLLPKKRLKKRRGFGL